MNEENTVGWEVVNEMTGKVRHSKQHLISESEPHRTKCGISLPDRRMCSDGCMGDVCRKCFPPMKRVVA